MLTRQIGGYKPNAHVTEDSQRKRQEVTVTVTVVVAAARTVTVTVISSHQEKKVASLNDAAMMMALIRPLMMQDFNVPFMKTRSSKQYCKAPCRLLMGRLRHHGLEQPWARASRTRLRPRG